MSQKKQVLSLLIMIVLVSTITACGSGGKKEGMGIRATEAQPDYNQTKSMVLDILHTKEGMLALKDVLRDPTFKQSLALSESDIATALNKSLTNGPNHQLIEAQMKDPKFATALVKSTKKEHTEILKSLMKDPEYQKDLLTVLQDPQYTKFQMSLMRTPTFRQELTKVMTEAIQNPEFKVSFINAVRENLGSGAAAQIQSSDKKQSKESGQSQEGSSQGGGEQSSEQKEES